MLGDKKVLYSGMQSTGNLTLGNYLGALKNWITLSDEYECFYSVANMHSITVRQNPAELRKHARELLTLFIAAGIDPEKNCIYYQSHVPAHAEPVSYTHLDVYKRQVRTVWPGGFLHGQISPSGQRRSVPEGCHCQSIGGRTSDYYCLLYTSRCV